MLIRACGLTSTTDCEALVDDYFLGEEEIPERGYALLDHAFGIVHVVNAAPPFTLPPVVQPPRDRPDNQEV